MNLNPARFLIKNFFNNPIFILGISRAGKTTLNKVLIRHSKIAFLSGSQESPFISHIATLAYQVEASEKSRYLSSKICLPKTYLYEKLKLLCVETSYGKMCGFKEILKSMVLKWDFPITKRYWCTQTFPSQEAYQGLQILYPQVKFIYLVRHPIGVVHDTMLKMKAKGKDTDLKATCLRWKNICESRTYMFGKDNVLIMKSEDLFREPERTLRSLFSFLNLKMERGSLVYLKKLITKSEDQANELFRDLKVDLRGSENNFREIMLGWDERQRSEFMDICGPGMQLLGYDFP